MPEWVKFVFEGTQLFINVAALIGGAIVWKMYVDNLKATLTVKDAEISSIEKNRDMWRDKAQELEKRSPEFMEKVLTERISTREAEIHRLTKDKEANSELLLLREQEKLVFERNLERSKGFRAMLALEGETESELDQPDDPKNGGDDGIEVVLLGMVSVDSGQLMITDPCYVGSQWGDEPFDLNRIYDDKDTGKAWKYGVDFLNYADLILDIGQTPRQLIGSGRFVEREMEVPDKFRYSYNGACQATLSSGHGELVHQEGHPGAGVVFNTAYGDGYYPVYGEKHDGRNVRIYINVI